jgi:hypothetical protein
MSDSSTSAIDDKNNENNNNSDDSDSDDWGGFALSLLKTSIFYFLIVLFASGYIFWTRVPYQLIMKIFPTLDSKFGREFYCPQSCKKGRAQHKEELKKRAIEIEQRRKEREQNRIRENNTAQVEKKGGRRARGGSAKCSQAKLELEKSHSFKINTPSGMMSFPYNLNDGDPSKMGTWFASSTQWVYIIYRWVIVTLLGWEVDKSEDSSNTNTSGTDTSGTDTSGTDTSGTDTSGTDTSGTDTSGTYDNIKTPVSDSSTDPIGLDSSNIQSMNDTTINGIDSNIPSIEKTSSDNSISMNKPTPSIQPTQSTQAIQPTTENTGLKSVEWNGGSATNNKESLDSTDKGTGNVSSLQPSETSNDQIFSEANLGKGLDPSSMLDKTDLPEISMPKISRPSFLNEDRDDDSENTMTNRFATYPGPLLFIMSMGVMLYFMTLLISTGLLTGGSGLYACWNAGFPWGFGYIFLFLFMSYFTGGINIAYQFFSGLYYFLIYPFMVNPSAVGEKFKYYPGFICSCNAGFLLVIYGLFILMAAGSNLTGSTQLGLGIGYYSLMILGLLFSGKKK